MKSASFFFLSVSLHAAVLAYPVTFAGRSYGELIRVTILPVESESVGSGNNGVSGSSAPRSKENSHSQRRPATSASVAAKPARSAEPQIVADEEVEKASESRVALTSALTASSEGDGTVSSAASAVVQSVADGTGGTGTGDNDDADGAGSGNGRGTGSGSGSSARGIALTQARYRETPRPNYPESARREGREGRVLLRVLVDDQGRTKRVQIHTSSGNDALDRAAAEAIQRWRFHPARYGDQPVASWLRIPIEFHLEDAKR
jgi:periplasmic protein TonB